MANALVSIQIIPKTGTIEETIKLVDAAIEVIDQSGVKYEVHPLETTMEGELSQLLGVIEKMNVRMIELGTPNVISQVKILYQPDGITMDRLTEKYRG
ncbi:thiamine-binding protein [Neobacillus piezotolerans]|uniref:Thiamine-binding protein n=1 Tax=Neobacillus piezotolerans TaxID=2259171 RepID=A0A3D8GU76_9BACI|nr:thiamine-binding protein [Neobacillus piezotolerans]RDU38020.1 thiamine-binding protein [Neobacillus piezotolerans]